eukprot:Nk52_evm1s360 gene=Nk52_evmTU1s360
MKSGRLKLKGVKLKKKKSKKSKKDGDVMQGEVSGADNSSSSSPLYFGRYWVVKETKDCCGRILIQSTQTGHFVKALNNGLLTRGDQEGEEEEGPEESEVFTVTEIRSGKYSIKTGYNRYLSCGKKSVSAGTANMSEVRIVDAHLEAVGTLETWEIVSLRGANSDEAGDEAQQVQIEGCVVPECNDFAFKSHYGDYLSMDRDGRVTAGSDVIGKNETFVLLNGSPRKQEQTEGGSSTAGLVLGGTGTLYSVEENLMKKYHADRNRDKYGRLLGEEGAGETRKKLKRANEEGRLNEVLLERRTKVKSDKFCK